MEVMGPSNPVMKNDSDENKENISFQMCGSDDAKKGFIPANLPNKHPLQNSWALWYLKADRNMDWEDCLKMISLFNSVEDFWSIYNHIQQPSGLVWGSDFYLFKDGIKPMWEDPGNIHGGRWLITIDRRERSKTLDKYWMEILMAVTGEQFEDLNEFICGVVVNIRNKGDKISLWTRDANRDDVNRRIGLLLKSILAIPDTDPIFYEVHKDSSKRKSSLVKPRIILPQPQKTATPSTSSQKL